MSGVVKAVNVDLAAGRGANRAKSLFLLYIDAVAATNVKAVTSAESGGSHVRNGCCSLARMRTHACVCLCVCLCVVDSSQPRICMPFKKSRSRPICSR